MRRALLVSLLLTLACKKDPPAPAPLASVSAAQTTPSASASGASRAASPEREAEAVIRAWNDALDKHDADALEKVYADSVVFYTLGSKPKKSVIAIKRSVLGPKSTFHQQIMDKIVVTNAGTNRWEATFTKRSGNGAKLGDTRALLVLTSDPPGSPPRIAEERDAPREKESCEAVATDVAWGSEPVKKVMNDVRKELPKHPDRTEGGIGPETFEDGSIQASIGVHHPDRFERIASYTVFTNGRLDLSVGAEEFTTDPSGQTWEGTPAKKLPEEARKRVTAACSHGHNDEHGHDEHGH